MNIEIKPEREHYTIYINGEFYCTADSIHEALEELEEEGAISYPADEEEEEE